MTATAYLAGHWSAARSWLRSKFLPTFSLSFDGPVWEPMPPLPPALLPTPSTAVLPIAPAPKGKVRRNKTQETPNAETLADLLDSVDDSFQTMTIPPCKGLAWLSRKDISALYKLGVFVKYDWAMELVKHPALPADMELPMLASAHMIRSHFDTKDRVHPRFIFALKQPRLPAACEQIAGVPYKFGYCAQVPKIAGHAEQSLFWLWAWVVVRPNGSIAVAHELRSVSHRIVHRRRQGGSRAHTMHQRQWMLPAAFQRDETSVLSQDDRTRFLLCEFRQLLLWWTGRSEMWSVGLRKGDHRVTFSIDQKHTAAFFADRGRQVSERGHSRKIIHYVAEHQRANGSKVRAHVRGLREFDWRGYHCFVTAPKLTGILATIAPLTPVLAEEGEPDTLSTNEAVTLMADAEDLLDSRRA